MAATYANPSPGAPVGKTRHQPPPWQKLHFYLSHLAFGSGFLTIAFGFWQTITLEWYIELTSQINWFIPYILIMIGSTITMVTLVVYLGGKSYISFKLYSILMMAVLQLFVAAEAFGFWIPTEASLKHGLSAAILDYEGQNSTINRLQHAFQCCGVDGYHDWLSIDWEGDGASNSVPDSCCVTETVGCGQNLTTDTINQQGCLDTTITHFRIQSGIIGTAGIIFLFIMLLYGYVTHRLYNQPVTSSADLEDDIPVNENSKIMVNIFSSSLDELETEIPANLRYDDDEIPANLRYDDDDEIPANLRYDDDEEIPATSRDNDDEEILANSRDNKEEIPATSRENNEEIPATSRDNKEEIPATSRDNVDDDRAVNASDNTEQKPVDSSNKVENDEKVNSSDNAP